MLSSTDFYIGIIVGWLLLWAYHKWQGKSAQ